MNPIVFNSIGKLIPKRVNFALARQALIVKKNSPTILFGLGVAGSVTGTVLACKATLKLPDKLDEIKKDVEELKDLKRDLDNGTTVTYTDEKYNKDMLFVYTKSIWSIAQLYGPAVIVSASSIALLTKSHNIQKNRNNVLMASYATLQEAYNQYRERVRDELGEERELDFFHGAKTEVVKNELNEKVEVKVFDPTKLPPFSVIFDDYSPYWEKDAEYNRMFLEGRRAHLNNVLKSRGHVFLNDVYDELGLMRTKEGAIMGWLKDGGPDEEGAGYIDFGVFAAYNAKFIKGHERSVLLTFNPDGVIFDKI